MTRIRVNTDDLRTKAKDFQSAADVLNKAGDEIAAAAMAMPSYDGQLSGPARKVGYEIQSQCRAASANFAADAQSLQNSAQAFEEVDNQAIKGFTQNQEALLSAGTSSGFDPIYSMGTSYLGYNWDPNNPNVMIICMYGVCKKVVRDDRNTTAFDNFRKDVDDYYAAKKATEKAWSDSLEYSAGIATTLAPTLGLGAIILLEKYFQANKDYLTNAQLMVDATHKVANDWNILTGGNLDGYEGPSYLYPYPYPYVSKPGEGKDVYEPPDIPISSETPEPGE